MQLALIATCHEGLKNKLKLKQMLLQLQEKNQRSNSQNSLVVCLLLYAFMVRHNAPAALIPIVWYALIKIFPSLASWVRIAITVILLALMFVFSNFFKYHILDAEKNHLETIMMVEDLIHLSTIAEKSLLPKVDLKTVVECSQQIIGDSKLVGRIFCLKTKPQYQNVAPIPNEEVTAAWLKAVKNYPLESVKFRLNVYLELLRDPSTKPYFYSFYGIYPNEMGLIQKNNAATVFLKDYIGGAANIAPFLFKPYWWLIVTLFALCATMVMRGDEDSLMLIRVLLFSALLYMLGYIPFAPMADFRFVYWSTLAISLAAIRFITSDLKFYMRIIMTNG